MLLVGERSGTVSDLVIGVDGGYQGSPIGSLLRDLGSKLPRGLARASTVSTFGQVTNHAGVKGDVGSVRGGPQSKTPPAGVPHVFHPLFQAGHPHPHQMIKQNHEHEFQRQYQVVQNQIESIIAALPPEDLFPQPVNESSGKGIVAVRSDLQNHVVHAFE